MRTVKFIKSEAENALQAYNEHWNTCSNCQFTPTSDDDVRTCYDAELLYEEYEGLISEADYAEKVFQTELKERELTT